MLNFYLFQNRLIDENYCLSTRWIDLKKIYNEDLAKLKSEIVIIYKIDILI